jgi:hypothetical protein
VEPPEPDCVVTVVPGAPDVVTVVAGGGAPAFLFEAQPAANRSIDVNTNINSVFIRKFPLYVCFSKTTSFLPDPISMG